MKQTVILGDSIFKGVLLAADENRYYVSREIDWAAIGREFGADIRNLSKMGCRTTHAPEILKKYLEKNDRPEVIVIELGGNDCDYDWKTVAKSPSRAYQPLTPFGQFQENYRALIALAQANAGKVILVNLPPIDEKSYFEWITRKGESRENILYFLHDDIGRIYRDQEMYSERIGKLAAETGRKLIDIRCSFLQCGDYRPLLCRDGIHPNSAGHQNIIRTFGEELAAS